MEIFEGHRALFRPLFRPALTLGNYDGVHLGHRELLARACRRAAELGGDSVCMTFAPHPAEVVSPESAPPRLTSLERKLELIASEGIDVAIVEPFDRSLAELAADAFVAEILVAAIGVLHLTVGYDFRYGRDRGGDADSLRAAGGRRGFGVDVVAPIVVDKQPISSSAIRDLLSRGDVAGAARLLGRPYDVDGTVVRGAGRGREIGVPTANLGSIAELTPGPGIYACWAEPLTGARAGERFMAAVSLGTNPTFAAAGPLTLEAHLLDFRENLYGARLRLSFVERLRDEVHYGGVEPLVAQIAEDVARARGLLGADATEGKGGR